MFRDWPIESLHPFAFKAAEAAQCAGEQGKYWEMHDRLFANQALLAPAELTKHAQAIALDATAFQQCLDSGKHAARIRKDLAEGQAAGVTGTPAFFVGWTVAGQATVKTVKDLRGAIPYAAFKQALDGLLAEPAPQ